MRFVFKSYIILSLGILFVFASCQKKEQEVSFDPATGCTNCAASTANKYLGILRAGSYTTTAASTSLTVLSGVSAYFSNEPVATPNVSNFVTVTDVFFNNDTLIASGSPLYYTTSKAVNLTTQTWSVTGVSGIPSFSFKYLHEKPTYTKMSVLPDTVRKSTGFVFIIEELSNITGASVFISDGLSSSPNVVSLALNEGTDTVTFSSENLMSLTNSNTALITVYFERAQAVKIDGKDFKFSKDASYTKTVAIKD